MVEYSASDLVVYRQLGEMLRLRRRELGLRQTDISVKLNLPQSSVSKIETGERKIELIEALSISEAYDLDIADLLATISKAKQA